MRHLFTACLSMIIMLCLVAVAHAHKVNLFAYVDGNTIVTNSGYSRSNRVQGGLVEVREAATGKLLLSGKTDKTGRFDFPVPEEAHRGKMDLQLLLKAGSGHQATWLVRYDEYGHGPAAVVSTEPDHTHETATVSPGTVSADEVERVVRRELAPVKQMLAGLQQAGPGLTEILGGIGYIIGLFGVVAYMKSRKA